MVVYRKSVENLQDLAIRFPSPVVQCRLADHPSLLPGNSAFITLEFPAIGGGHYNIVTSASTRRFVSRQFRLVSFAVLCFVASVGFIQSRLFGAQTPPADGPRPAWARQTPSPQELFTDGESALRAGDNERAERDFRRVLANDPRSAGAYANLGVVYMRRKHWEQALNALQKAERLAPTVAGIRLNIGLAYYRQNNFRSAVSPFESVLRDQPDSTQARYLLGLCYFFNDRWDDATTTLEPLWTQQWLNMSYLYVLGIAAHKAGRNELEDKAIGRLVQLGQDTPEFHLLMGKAFINREEDDNAISELEKATRGNPKLPFVHFNLGLVYLHKQDYERAASEFKADIAVEPDVSYSYLRLADVYVQQQNDAAAEKNYRHAVRLDPKLAAGYLGLAKVYSRQGKYREALSALSAEEKLDPQNYDSHYIRGQILNHMGQREKAKAEFDTYAREMNAAREKRGRELRSDIPTPDLTAEPK